MLRIAALLGTLVALAIAGGASSATSGEPFFVGFSEDLPKEVGASAVTPATALGGRAFRLTTLWSPDRTTLTAEERAKLDRAVAAAAGQRIVLAVFADAGAKAPQTATAREAYCGYVRALLLSYPSIRDVVIWNEPNKNLFWSPQSTAATRYEELLAHCHGVLHAAFANVNVVGLALSSTGNDDAGSTSPGEFIREVGDSYRANQRVGRIMDTVGYHPYPTAASERPWRRHISSKTIAQGDWNKLMYNLFLAFDGAAQPIPGEEDVRIWYTESGYQTAVDPAKAAAYSGAENVATIPDDAGGEPEAPAPAETSAAPDQRTQALDAIRLAACQPYVGAYFNFLLADEPRLAGWQSGPYWADLTQKGSAAAFAQAISEASSGTVGCDTLKGGKPSADFMPPGTPADVRGAAATGPLRVELAWTAATDDQSAISYRIYRDGAHVGTTAETSWANTAVAPNTSYAYVIRALDAAGNLGSASAAVNITTGEEPPPTPTPTENVPPIPEPGAPSDPAPAPTPVIEVATPPVQPAPIAPNLAPTAPGRLRASIAKGIVRLTWLKSRDAGGVRAYLVFRDGTLRRTLRSLSFSERALRGRHVYTVRAVDTSGLRGPAARVAVRR